VIEGVSSISRLVGDGGWLVVLLLLLYGLHKGWWASGREVRALRSALEQERRRSERLERLAFSGTELAERAEKILKEERGSE
jgi:acyl carrier protein phosphodiesterase